MSFSGLAVQKYGLDTGVLRKLRDQRARMQWEEDDAGNENMETTSLNKNTFRLSCPTWFLFFALCGLLSILIFFELKSH